MKFEVIRVSGVAIGVGVTSRVNSGLYSEQVCNTYFDTGSPKEDAKESNKWAAIICDALNSEAYDNKLKELQS